MKQTIKKAVKKIVPEGVYNHIIIPRHIAESALANLKYGFPARKGMTVIGVTGTNGKTTTCNMIAAIFEAAGKKVGLMSSAVIQIGDKREENHIHFTTAKGMILQRYLKRMKAAGVEIVVLEAASQALSQFRMLGIPIDTAVITNLTQDHLDYHGTMQRYAHAKAKLFKHAKRFAVVNADDKWVEVFKRSTDALVMEYGEAGTDARLLESHITAAGAAFKVLDANGRQHNFSIKLTGLFNVYNALAAISVGWAHKLPDATIQRGFDALEFVPGRMQSLNLGQPFTVIIDHAHTTDALENLYKAVKPVVKGRILLVIGCDGDRDPGKREPIGAMSARFADKLFLTELENYTEDPARILKMVRAGIESVPASERCDWVEIPDRREAIAAALREARTGDMVLIPGMGNQDTRGAAFGMEQWDDREVTREELQKLKR